MSRINTNGISSMIRSQCIGTRTLLLCRPRSNASTGVRIRSSGRRRSLWPHRQANRSRSNSSPPKPPSETPSRPITSVGTAEGSLSEVSNLLVQSAGPGPATRRTPAGLSTDEQKRANQAPGRLDPVDDINRIQQLRVLPRREAAQRHVRLRDVEASPRLRPFTSVSINSAGARPWQHGPLGHRRRRCLGPDRRTRLQGFPAPGLNARRPCRSPATLAPSHSHILARYSTQEGSAIVGFDQPVPATRLASRRPFHDRQPSH